MDIGASLTYTVGVSCSFSGSTTMDFGLQATVPDSAQIVADYNNPKANKVTGFGEGQLTPTSVITDESVSANLIAFSQPEIDFGIDLHQAGKMGMAVTIKLPELSVNLTAKSGTFVLSTYY